MPEATASPGTTVAAIALGSNLTPVTADQPRSREANLQLAIEHIGATLGRVLAVSSFYDTAPVGYLDQPRFLNGALLLETALDAPSLMRSLLAIERRMGRDRSNPVGLNTGAMNPAPQTAILKGPRVIDLDLLLFGQLIVDTPELTVPHPAMWSRRFVLEPLAEIAGSMVDPVSRKTVAERLQAIADKAMVDGVARTNLPHKL